MTSKEQAIRQIGDIALAHDISIEELAAALGRQQIDARKKDASTLTRVFSYLGGIFILAGLCAYIGLSWAHLNSASRVLITYGPGLICLIISVVMAFQQKNEKNINILVLLSAILQPSGLFVAVYEFAQGGGNVWLAALAIFAVLGLQYGVLFLKLKRTAFLFFTIYFSTAAFASLCDIVHIPGDLTEFICGVSLLCISYGLQRTRYNSICGFGYFVGSVSLLWMGFDLTERTPFEILYLVLPSFMLYASTIVRSRSMLVTSAIALFSYISYFTERNFMDSAGWPVCLILLGFIFFGISHLTVKLGKRLAA